MRTKLLHILLAVAALSCLGLGAPGESLAADSAVRVVNGLPRLVVDGREAPATGFYEVYYYPSKGRPIPNQPDYRDPRWVAAMRRVVDTAVAQGVRMVMASIWWGDVDGASRRPANPAKAYDFAPFDAFMDYARSRGVGVVVKTSVNHFLPRWWLAEQGFPDNAGYQEHSRCALCETDAYGTAYGNPSMGSLAVRRDYTPFLSALVARYRTHPALVGWAFGLGPTGEDAYGPNYIVVDAPGGGRGLGRKPMMFTDYSPDFTARFRDWLKRKYGSDAALRRAWNDPGVSLAKFRTPPPQELVRDPAAFSREPFPDPAIDRGIDPATVLTAKGMDFYAFRVQARESDTAYYAGLIKKLDPRHVLLFNARARASARQQPDIDGIFFNPHPLFGRPLFHEVNQFYTILHSVEGIVRQGKLALVAAENSPQRTPANGRWETPEQINYITALGYGVKSLGGIMGYAVDLLDPGTTDHWLPTWFSNEAKAAERAIAAYNPAPGAGPCDPIRELRRQNRCDAGPSRPQGCGLIDLAYFNYCHTGGECDANHDGTVTPEELAACRGHAPQGAPAAPMGMSGGGAGLSGKPTGKCGDGVCDDFERSHGVCPQDCGSTTGQPSGGGSYAPAAPMGASGGGGGLSGAPSGKCGDGVCDDFERSHGVCSQDCGSATGKPTGGSSSAPARSFGASGGGAGLSGKPAGKCGDGICDDFERSKGVCPQDCSGTSGQPSGGGSSAPGATTP
ncbi:MAG: beta-galactosidase [Desulfovibrio sp.]